MRKRNPFVRSQGTPVKVFTDPDGVGVHFLSTGSIDGNTNPIDVQEAQRKEAEIAAILLDAVDNLAKEKNVSRNEARELFKSQEIDGTQVEGLNPIDYLSSEERILFFKLSQETQELPNKIATIFCQHRLLYTIHLTQAADQGTTTLFINEPWFDMQVGNWFKFDNTLIKVLQPYNPDTDTIGVQALSTALNVDAEAHLLQSNRRDFVVGDSSWTDKQTQELSVMSSDGDGQIQAIYQFYLKEAGRLTEDETEGESQQQTTLEPLPSLPASIGQNSTANVVTTGSQSLMIGSDTRILETAQIG
jgi:hypothetical protein